MEKKIVIEKDDWKNKDAEFWKNIREELYKLLNRKEEKLEKIPKNIYKMAKESGVKPAARYFNIQPSQVRYYVKKIENGKKI